ncbi:MULTISPECIES: AAA family ATPase [Lactobacillus]|uniref:AAA family ATPase n=1 Tax=Lactobacillus TaxID=1578 RepID=UPI0018DCA930|nr:MULTISPECIES: excinuclease ABC subunit UvrA [unclassified Lactobacillus]MBI0121205.1 excinuclease ABC subunit UvrA [Lactobacillus sp. M0398]MBI0123352.1 excinuclease ABC subunit UvrA [Lactobacillus sp. W8174]MBI0135583.1 excinuclease ABC subunit UvrA [Lactobacillus sp. W8173]
MKYQKQPNKIEVIGGRVNNLKNIDVDIPLHKFVAISGLSGSGKSSLAMGILYSEGARRYLDSLAAYTRRRISQVGRAQVDEVKHIPSALALRQRPAVPGVRSTVGTVTEIFNIIRLIFSRLGSPVCPNGHRVPPTIKIAEAMDLTGEAMGRLTCPTCGVQFYAFSAEDFAFNSDGACQKCQGLGTVEQIDDSKIIADENLSLEKGAVATWQIPGRNWMWRIARELGVRTDIPYKKLNAKEKDIVLHGKERKVPIDLPTSTGRVYHLDALYENAYNAVANSRKTTKSERGLQRINSFYKFSTCSRCHGYRIDPSRWQQLVAGKNIVEAEKLTLGELTQYMDEILASLPQDMQDLAENLTSELLHQVKPLLKLGLDYLSIDRQASSLSTGELQRIQLGRTLRTETTGVLYVLDEPSVGLHPDNVAGLIDVFHELVNQGNSLVVVDHETAIINAADWVIEIGPGSGSQGGRIISQGIPKEIEHNEKSLIGPYLTGKAPLFVRPRANKDQIFKHGKVEFDVTERFNLKNLHVQIPVNRLTSVTGFSGAGKTTLILDSLIPALKAQKNNSERPKWVKNLDNDYIKNVVSVDSTPVGKNQRSTVATYTDIMDNLRKLFAKQPLAKKLKYRASHFSYNNKEGACPACGGTGVIALDIQYLPDMVETCSVCGGHRFNQNVLQVKWHNLSIADVLDYSVDDALKEEIFQKEPKINKTITTLHDMGLGYLHLGESTPALSGGEAQRLKLTSHIHQRQKGTLFVFDEPTVGLHPQDVRTLLQVFQRLLEQEGTIITITHDLDIMANSDYMIDMGPRGGQQGGKIIASGTPVDISQNSGSLTGKYLAKQFKLYQK